MLTFTFNIVCPCFLFLFLLDIMDSFKPVISLHWFLNFISHRKITTLHSIFMIYQFFLGFEKVCKFLSNAGKESPLGDTCQGPQQGCLASSSPHCFPHSYFPDFLAHFPPWNYRKVPTLLIIPGLYSDNTLSSWLCFILQLHCLLNASYLWLTEPLPAWCPNSSKSLPTDSHPNHLHPCLRLSSPSSPSLLLLHPMIPD